ncbi:Erg28-like protein [Ceraceosorus guamensis]|uniref:Erg28-like protein n=1 Tax=Ceraceosorus guamensis TaxID=1522189 RepID=A0A316W010_9BASI|nr:Erg28-like protein [Ceraceosorus guamensis]PWN43110.1 Erg28-like protein [Ceraceosorus guamensis]
MSFDVASLIPPGDGVLPKWLLLVASMAYINGVQTFLNPSFARQVYNASGAQGTALQARCFAIWNLGSATVRTYAAYHIHNREVYHLCALTFVIAILHFSSEAIVYKTTKMSKLPGIVVPLIVASSSLTAMILQYGHYVA